MASSSQAVPLVAPAVEDLEQGWEADPASADEAFLYSSLYGISLCIVVVSIWALLFPFSNSAFVGSMVGSGGLLVGVFLVLNGDVFVNYLRLWREQGRFKEGNERFKDSLVRQKSAIRSLQQTERALATLEKRFRRSLDDLDSLQEKGGGLLAQIQGELDEITAIARDSTRGNIEGTLLAALPGNLDITSKDLPAIFQAFSNGYVRIVPGTEARVEEMRNGFEASTRWKEVNSLSIDRLKFILAGVLFEDIRGVKEWTRSHVEVETDEQAASLSWRGDKDTNAPSISWAEAAAFAGVA